MLTRLRALLIAAFLVAIIGGLPALTPPAHAENRTVTVATYDEEPFVITRDNVKTGFTVDLLTAIGKRVGWNIVYVEPGATNSKGLLKALTEGRADMAANSITITAERRKGFDFSQPTLDSGLRIAVPADSAQPSLPGLKDFLKLLFSKTMLVWLGAALALSVIPAHIIWLLERRHPESMVAKSYFPGIFQALGWGLNMLAAAPEGGPRHWQSRALALVWAFVSIIFVAYYTATLTANLTVEKFDDQVNSPADLVGKRVCTIGETTTADYLAEIGVEFEGVVRIEDCFARLKDGTTDAIVYDSPVLNYWVANEGHSVGRLTGTMFNPDTDGIAFPLDSPLLDPVDSALLSIKESGEYELIKEKWFGNEDAE